MTREELRQLVAEVRQRQSELDSVEFRMARGGMPKRLYESLSAFANQRLEGERSKNKWKPRRAR